MARTLTFYQLTGQSYPDVLEGRPTEVLIRGEAGIVGNEENDPSTAS